MVDRCLSYNENNKKEVTFFAEGKEGCSGTDVVISMKNAILCIKQFLSVYERSSCIQWQEL